MNYPLSLFLVLVSFMSPGSPGRFETRDSSEFEPVAFVHQGLARFDHVVIYRRRLPKKYLRIFQFNGLSPGPFFGVRRERGLEASLRVEIELESETRTYREVVGCSDEPRVVDAEDNDHAFAAIRSKMFG